jgi:predicted RNA-binding protein with PUA-like domain
MKGIMSYWIFQASPDAYKLIDALAALSDNWVWEVNQHASEIHSGDKAMIWKAGEESGVYALAEVTSEPEMRLDEDVHWVDKARGQTPSLRVTIRITARFLEKPLLRSQLKLDPQLEKLSILRFAQGTNFPVTETEWAHLTDLLGIDTEAIGTHVGTAADGGLDIAEIHLRQALAKNLNQIEMGLTPFFEEKVEEYPVPNGRIDLLCKDQTGVPVVVELKRHQWDTHKSVGQIAGYMGWAKQNIAAGGHVRGILLVLDEGDMPARIEAAVPAVPGLEVRRYSISISIK